MTWEAAIKTVGLLYVTGMAAGLALRVAKVEHPVATLAAVTGAQLAALHYVSVGGKR